MRAIIIEEDRFTEVLTLVRSECTRIPENGYLLKNIGLTKEQAKFAADEMFRCFNYHFVRWAQSHGASCVER